MAITEITPAQSLHESRPRLVDRLVLGIGKVGCQLGISGAQSLPVIESLDLRVIKIVRDDENGDWVTGIGSLTELEEWVVSFVREDRRLFHHVTKQIGENRYEKNPAQPRHNVTATDIRLSEIRRVRNELNASMHRA